MSSYSVSMTVKRKPNVFCLTIKPDLHDHITKYCTLYILETIPAFSGACQNIVRSFLKALDVEWMVDQSLTQLRLAASQCKYLV